MVKAMQLSVSDGTQPGVTAAVRVERQAGLWLLVERPGGAGWVQVGEVARL